MDNSKLIASTLNTAIKATQNALKTSALTECENKHTITQALDRAMTHLLVAAATIDKQQRQAHLARLEVGIERRATAIENARKRRKK